MKMNVVGILRSCQDEKSPLRRMVDTGAKGSGVNMNQMAFRLRGYRLPPHVNVHYRHVPAVAAALLREHQG